MALVQQDLRSALLRLAQDLSSSKTEQPAGLANPEVADGWARAYLSYAVKAQAGVLLPILLTKELISAGIMSSPADFYLGLTFGLESFWAASIWAGPGFIPVNPAAPGTFLGAPLLVELKALGLEFVAKRNVPLDEAIERIASSLHNYTTRIMVVSTTTSVPPVVAPLPIL